MKYQDSIKGRRMSCRGFVQKADNPELPTLPIARDSSYRSDLNFKNAPPYGAYCKATRELDLSRAHRSCRDQYFDIIRNSFFARFCRSQPAATGGPKLRWSERKAQ